MKIESILFNQLFIGNYPCVASGPITIDSIRYSFQILWKENHALRVAFDTNVYEAYSPSEQIRLEQVIREKYKKVLYEFIHKGKRREDDTEETWRNKVIGRHLSILREGCQMKLGKAAKKLWLSQERLLHAEIGWIDFEKDILKYVDPKDALLPRIAKLYHVRGDDWQALDSPYFFAECCVRDFSIDLYRKRF